MNFCKCIYLRISILFAILLEFMKLDIPTHCLSHQIFGDWIFYQTETVVKEIPELYDFKCGIKDHTNKEEIYKFNMDKNLFKNSFKIRLSKKHDAQVLEVGDFFKGSKVK